MPDFRVSVHCLTLIVEAVEKVPREAFGSVGGKNDLIECATINDLMPGRHQATPGNHPTGPLRGFFYRLVTHKEYKINLIILSVV